MPIGWFRAKIEEALMASLAVPLYLTEPLGRLIDELMNESGRLNYGSAGKVLKTLRASVILGFTPSTTKGLLPSVMSTMYTAEKLGIEPSVAILEVDGELNRELTNLVNTYRDLTILTNTLIILLLAIMPMVLVFIGQALGISVTQFLIINYATTIPMSLLLLLNLDPGILRLSRGIALRFAISLIPLTITYTLTKSPAISWLTASLAFLALTLRQYMDYNQDLATMNWRIKDSLMTSSMGIRQYRQPRVWNDLDRFFNEYTRIITVTGMGRPDVVSTALTTSTSVITAIKDSRRISIYSALVSTSFIITLMVIIALIISQAHMASSMTWLLPTAILGGFFSGYLIDSVITGVYFTIPTTITYIIITTLLLPH